MEDIPQIDGRLYRHAAGSSASRYRRIADPEPAANIPKYRMLNLVGRWLGFRLVVAQVMPIMFGQKFLNDPMRAQLRAEWRLLLLANHRVGITRATAGVITRQGIPDLL